MKQLCHIFTLSIVILLGGCVEPVPFEDLPSSVAEVKLVVESEFTNNLNFRVVVSKSHSFDNADSSLPIEYVDNAEVSIFSKGELLEVLTYFPAGEKGQIPCYGSVHLTGEVGVKYEIKVEATGFQTITSEDQIPYPSKVSGTEFQANTNGQESFWVSLEITDEEQAVENYFFLNIYQLVRLEDDGGAIQSNFETKSLPLQLFNFNPDQPVEFYLDNRGALLTDKYFSNNSRDFTFKTYLDFQPRHGDFGKMVLELKTINKRYYDYLLNLKRQFSGSDNPFSEPGVDHSNIQNGFGFFAGFSTATDTLVIKR